MTKISNNLIVVLIIIFGAIVSYNNWLIYKNVELIDVTGQTTKTGTITLTLLSPGNNNATITSTPVTTATEDSLYTYNVIATDVDGDYINFFDNTTLFDINPTSGLISFTPKTDKEAGSHTIKILVFDFQGGFASQVYNLSISAVNDAPVLDFIGTITSQEDKVSTFSVGAADEETASSDLIYNVSGASFANITSNIITFSPKVGDAGTDYINITVSDGSLTDSENVTLFVLDYSNVNNAPTIESFSPTESAVTIRADTNQTFNVTFNDDDGNNSASIQWFSDGLAISGETNNSYTFIGNFTDAGSNAGLHKIRVDVSDGLATTSHSWTLNVNITRDADGDGIPDYLDSCPFISGTCDSSNLDMDNISDAVDFLLGDVTFVDKNIPLDFKVDGSTDLNKVFNGTLPVKFTTEVVVGGVLYTQPTVEFDFGFNSETKLNLNDMTIKHFDTNNIGSVLIAGINLAAQSLTKTIHMKKVNASINGVCIKDKIISSINEITSACNGTSETKVDCDGTTQSGYTCTLNTTTDYYQIKGLNHSGSKQINFTKPASPGTATSATTATIPTGGGGGGGVPSLGAGAIPQESVESEKIQVWSEVEGGTSISMDISKESIPVTAIIMEVKEQVKNLVLSVQSLKYNLVAKSAGSKIYRYMQITKNNIANSQINKITIKFKVSKTWIEENSIQPSDIALFKYNNGAWEQLYTENVGSDITNAYYQAITPGLSFFAIGAKTISGKRPSEDAAGQLPIIIDPDLINIVLTQNSSTTRILTLKNPLNAPLKIEFKIENLESYITLSDTLAFLDKYDERILTLDISAPESIDVHQGKLIVTVNEKVASIPILIHVNPKSPLIEVAVEIPKRYKRVQKGGNVEGIVEIMYYGKEKPVDVQLFYAIKDLDGKTISSKEDIIEVDDGALITKKIGIPENVHAGKHIFYAKATRNSNIAIGSDIFVVSEIILSQEDKEALFKFALIITVALLTAMALINISMLVERIPKSIKKKATKEVEYEELKQGILALEYGTKEKGFHINPKVKAILLSVANLPKRLVHFIKREQVTIGKTKKKFSIEELEKHMEILNSEFKAGIVAKKSYKKQMKKLKRIIKETKKQQEKVQKKA